MKKNKIKNVPEYLLETGLLFEINRNILHKFGLALEVIIDDDNKIAFGDIWDFRNDPEGIIFDAESFQVGFSKYEKFLKEFGSERLKTRQDELGYIIQELNSTVQEILEYEPDTTTEKDES